MNFPPSPRPTGRLRCEPLEDRTVPAVLSVADAQTQIYQDKLVGSLPAPTDLPASPTEIVARTASAQPLTDLANAVAALYLGGVIDADRSAIAFTTGNESVVQVALRGGASVPDAVRALAGTGLYSDVAPNYVYPTGRSSADLRERATNDPLFGSQFYLPVIRAPQAFDKTTGSPTVVTAVLDDGLDVSQPDLADNLFVNPKEIAGNGRDDDGNGFADDVNGYDFVHDSGNVRPDDPTVDTHGTEIAGVIAGRSDNGVGIAGVAGRSRVMPLKVVGNGPTTSLTLARAVAYAVKNGAKIINCSINVDPFVGDPTFQAAVDYAYTSGLLWVNSAGNLNVLDPTRQTFEEMLLVAATDRNDVKTAYSNYGSGIDLSAPGGTPGDGLLTTEPGGGFGSDVGTSLSAAVVSGTAALVWSAFPNLTRDQVVSELLTTADDIAAKNPGFDFQLGAGRVNAQRAVAGPATTRLGPLTGLPDDGQTAEGTISGFSLRLLAPLAPGSVVSSNFTLTAAGPDGTFDIADDRAEPLTINAGRAYRVGTNSLDFTLDSTLAPGCTGSPPRT